ncbi:hypothetical protein Fcan01_21633 [Folsomia candida]|uniref:Uncharacterized protein n=1 Tax=Folsomia candida TaxID=158441 RepID=A0A226DF82_FOLCA|nr:hypothetical protein Fcan01_21633 [Folsomia candida]
MPEPAVLFVAYLCGGSGYLRVGGYLGMVVIWGWVVVWGRWLSEGAWLSAGGGYLRGQGVKFHYHWWYKTSGGQAGRPQPRRATGLNPITDEHWWSWWASRPQPGRATGIKSHNV